MVARACFVLAFCGAACANRVRRADAPVPIFGVNTGPTAGRGSPFKFRPEETQAEMLAFLKKIGYDQYATKDFADKLNDELACDSIDDLASLTEDDEYQELGISATDAVKIMKAAQREILLAFLASVPSPNGTVTGEYTRHLGALLNADCEEVDDVADLDEEEAVSHGIPGNEARVISSAAEKWEARATFNELLYSLKDTDGSYPYRNEEVLLQMVGSLVKAGIHSYGDLGSATAVPGISPEDLKKLQATDLVRAFTNKQEL